MRLSSGEVSRLKSNLASKIGNQWCRLRRGRRQENDRMVREPMEKSEKPRIRLKLRAVALCGNMT